MNDDQKQLLLETLGVLAAGAVVAAAIVAPGILVALAPFMAKETRSDRRKVYESLRYAKRQKWIRVTTTQDGVRAEITKKGRRRWEQLRFDRPLTDTHWDKKWRIVIFDIPNKQKVAREGVRDALKRLGFHQLQKSVWITPWPCEDHIEALRNFYLVPKCIQVIETIHVDQQKRLSERFNLKG